MALKDLGLNEWVWLALLVILINALAFTVLKTYWDAAP